jgi:hypothetical protein
MLDLVARRYGRLPHEVAGLDPADFLLALTAALVGEDRDAKIEAAKWGKR